MFKIYNNLESRLKRLYGKDPTNDSWHLHERKQTSVYSDVSR